MRTPSLDSSGTFVAFLFRRVGDSLLATPALRALKAAYPDSRLCVLSEEHVARVFTGLHYVDETIVTPASPNAFQLATSIREIKGVAATVDFLSDPRTAFASAMSGVRTRAGFAKSWRSILYTHRVAVQDRSKPIYSAIHKLRLAETLGAESNGAETDFWISESNFRIASEREEVIGQSGRPIIAFYVTSRRVYKRWPLERFAEVIKMAKVNCAVSLIGGENERATLLENARVLDLPEESVSVFSDIGDLAAFLSRCALYVGNDGGPKHLAVAVNTPTVTIFQNDPSEYWTPLSPLHIALGGENHSPSAHEVVECVQRILKK